METNTIFWEAIMQGAIIGMATACIIIGIAEAIYIYKQHKKTRR